MIVIILLRLYCRRPSFIFVADLNNTVFLLSCSFYFPEVYLKYSYKQTIRARVVLIIVLSFRFVSVVRRKYSDNYCLRSCKRCAVKYLFKNINSCNFKIPISVRVRSVDAAEEWLAFTVQENSIKVSRQ
jgi:hypothetical protein